MQNISKSDIYFFNNQYSDKIVMESLIENREKNFYQSLRHQKVIHGLDRATGLLSDFSINEKVNALLGIPEDSLTCHLDSSIVPYYNKKEFLDKYHYNQPISLQTIMEDHSVFSDMVICQIGPVFCFGIMVAETVDGCYIIITQKRSTGLSEKAINTLFSNDQRWYIFFQKHVDVYHAYKNKYLIFTGKYDDKKGRYYIPMSVFSSVIKVNKPYPVNKWALYITCMNNTENIMVGTTDATIVKLNDKLEYLSIDKKFADYILPSITNCKCYLINEYKKATSLILPTNGSTEISFLAQYKHNPIPPENIKIYAYDPEKAMILHTMSITGGISKHPSFHSYTINLANGEELPEYVYIEMYESESCCRYDNIMKDLMDLYGYEFYTKMMNGEFTSDIVNYEPAHLSVYDFKEFQEFSEYPDIRAFRLQYLIETLKENPARYKDLSKKFAMLNKASIRHEYIQSESPNVFSRSVTSNIGEISDPNDEFKFSEPMMYFKVHLSKDITPSAIVFVNGIRVNTERIHTIKNDSFIYIKRSHLKDDLDNIIEVEVFLEDSTKKNKVESEITFFSTGVSHIIPEAFKFGKLSIENLIFYDRMSKDYLRPDEITYRYSLSLMEITPPTGEPIEFYYDTGDVEFFATAEGEYFTDENNTFLTVRKDNQIEDIPSSSYKILDVSRMYAVLKSAFRLNKELVITNVNTYRKGYLKDGLLSASIIMKNFTGTPDIRRFRVYYGGRLLNDTDYTISLPVKYGGDVIVSLSNISAIDNNREVIVDYLPLVEECVYAGIPDDTLFHDGLFWFTDINYPLLPELLKIYINGIRVPSSKLIDIGATNIFKLEGYVKGDWLQIFMNGTDPYIYDFLDSQRIINSELEVNSEFRDYMISK